MFETDINIYSTYTFKMNPWKKNPSDITHILRFSTIPCAAHDKHRTRAACFVVKTTQGLFTPSSIYTLHLSPLREMLKTIYLYSPVLF